ncbi:MAG: non-reducing end alpha-L-arabinofuranosidase family hydrolase [Polyangiaceae bacterium]
MHVRQDLSRLHWRSGPPLLNPSANGLQNVVALKDPSIVRFAGRWHVYVTTVAAGGVYGMAYVSFADFEEAGAASFYSMRRTPGFDRYVAAPQLFYFTPQKKWYLVFQSGPPMYSTNDSPSEPGRWTPPAPFFESTPAGIDESGGWLDFWVIADATHCHLFFSNDHGRWYKSKTRVEDFPHGFSAPVVVLEDSEAGRLYEACCVYSVAGTGQYLALIEAFDQGSEQRRYFRSFTAGSLEGPWQSLHDAADAPFAGLANTSFDGAAWSADISHGELVRSGCDETLSVELGDLRYLYQGCDPSVDTRDYNAIPWKLALLTRRP